MNQRNMSIETKVSVLPKSEVEIAVTLAWEEWRNEINHAVEHLAEHIKIDGFRKGKVPRELLEQKIGKQAVLDEAAEHTIQHVYPRVLEQEKIDALGRPQADIKKVEEGGALEFVVKTAVVPKLTLKEWRKAVKKINSDFAKKEVTVSDEEIDKEIRRLAESRAKLITVDREARMGDTAVLDFQVFRDGVPIENGSSKQHPIVLGSGAFIPGFEEKIVGLKAGEETSFELTFPEKYHAKELAGKLATFQVKLQAVQERDIPELDDAFAQSLGKFQTIGEVRDNFRTGMLEEKQHQTKEERRTEIVDTLVEASSVEIPQVLVDEELVKMLQEFEQQVQAFGMDFETYLSGIDKTKEQLFTDWEPQAKKRVTAALALETVAQEMEIDPMSEEIEMEMNKILQRYREVKDIEKKLDMNRLYQHARGQLRNEKTFEYLENLG